MTRDEFYKKFEALNIAFEKLEPELELTVRDPELGVEGYVVVWTTLAAIGGPLGRCGKGGTRITPQVSLDEIKMLAKIMALKNAAAGLPLGGAKSGMKGDPDSPDFEKKYRRFVSLVKPTLRENGGVFGGFGFDIGGRPIHPTWACDELKSTKSFTGKPVEMGGTDYDKEGIAGLGVSVAAETALKFFNKDIKKTTCAIQGLGAMGAAVFKYFTEAGGEVVAISDPSIGGTYRLSGQLQIRIRDAIINQDLAFIHRLLVEQNVPQLALDSIIFQEADVLFPCAVQGVINAANEGKIKARYIVEGANNPTSEEARTLLFNRGVTVIPDFIANPGGIIAAFVEMTSSLSPDENVKTRGNVLEAKKITRERIAKNVEDVLKLAQELNLEPVHVGRYLALSRIFRESK